ncbi:MAG: endonuclease/exonuclease/phosphatase family protein [Planctomycetes bacterium]|nr:endonuclease/exonuclease/phosphatase family protein [Planctomycetota bacterium]
MGAVPAELAMNYCLAARVKGWAIAALLACAACSGTREEREVERLPIPEELRILTWNLHHGEGGDGRFDLERIASVIRASDPDWVALQEIDRGVRRTQGIDMPAELARLTGLHPVFGDNLDYQGGRYGNLALVRTPPEHAMNHALPSHYVGEQRGLLELQWSTPHGVRRFFVTHWDYRGDYEGERLASVEHMRTRLEESAHELAVLAGDLNALPSSGVIACLDGFLDPAHGATPQPTYPAASPERMIDYVWLDAAESSWSVQRCEVLGEATASDHRPLLVVLRRD